MGDWWIALIAAGAALAGSLVTGWFTRAAGAQRADALVQAVLTVSRDQRSAREADLRRGAYAEFLAAAETLVLTRRTRVGDPGDLPALRRAFSAVLLEGPAEAARTARELVDLLGTGHGSPDTIEQRREAFVAAARQALRPADPAPPQPAGTTGPDPSLPPG